MLSRRDGRIRPNMGLASFSVAELTNIDIANVDFKGYKPAHAVSQFWNTWEYSI